MKKIKYIAIIIGMVCLGMVTSTSVSAATWHKGTPKVTRGHWMKSDKVNMGGKILSSKEYFTVTKKSISDSRTGWSASYWSNVRYRKTVNGNYLVLATYHNGGMLTEKNSKMKLTKSHGKLGYKNTWSSRVSYLSWFSKR